jgi:hypothetical protein
VVQVSEIGSVDGVTGKKAGWQWGDAAGVELEEGGIRARQGTKLVGAVTEVGDDHEGAATLIGQFGNFILGGVTLDLDGGHDFVADFIQNGVARFVSSVLGVSNAAVFDEEME